MLLCGQDRIVYEFSDGVLYECNGELIHAKAVLSRMNDNRPTIFMMRNLSVPDDVYGQCNFPYIEFSGTTPLKFSGSVVEVQKRLPALVATHKVRQVAFDEPDLFSQFQIPGLSRLTKLVPYVDDGHHQLVKSSIKRPRTAPPVPRQNSPTFQPKSESSGIGKVIAWGAIIILVIILIRSC